MRRRSLAQDQYVTAGPTRDREIVVEVALAVGDHHDGAVGGQNGEAGGLGVEPALRFLVGRFLVPAILAFAAFVGGAHPDVLVKQSQRQAVGGQGQGGVNEEAEMLGVGQLPQATVACGAGEVGVGGVLSDQEDAGVARRPDRPSNGYGRFLESEPVAHDQPMGYGLGLWTIGGPAYFFFAGSVGVSSMVVSMSPRRTSS